MASAVGFFVLVTLGCGSADDGATVVSDGSGGAAPGSGGGATGGKLGAGGSLASGGAAGRTGTGGAFGTGGQSDARTGGSTGSGGKPVTDAGTGGAAGTGGTVVRSDAGPGVWEEISPAGLDYACVSLQNYGVESIVGGNTDAPNTFYVGVGKYAGAGIWKTTDGGDNWWNVSGSQLVGANGSLAIDFTDSNILYSGQLYGGLSSCCGYNGIAKSTDGGVTWKQVGNRAGMNSDVNYIVIDPTDHLHVLVTTHSGTPQIYETFDGGATWLIQTPLPFSGGVVYFLDKDDSGQATGNVWIFQSVGSGTWRTTTGGRVGGTAAQNYRDGAPGAGAWTQVSTLNKTHGSSAIARLTSGSILMAVETTVARSDDNGKSWIDMAAGAGKGGDLPTCGDASAGLANDGVHIWTMRSNTGCGTCGSYPADFPGKGCSNTKGYRWLVTATSGDGTHWAEYNTQAFQDGPSDHMLYAPTTNTVYSPNWCTGLFRLKL